MRSYTRFTLAAALFAAVSPLSALAVTIDFTGLAGANNSSFTTFGESNYSVNVTAGTFDVSTTLGDPGLSIYAHSGTITITRPDPPAPSNLFDFTGVDLDTITGAAGTYTITGLLNGVQQFTTTGTAGTGGFVLDGTGESGFALDTLTIAFSGGNSDTHVDLDNIGVEGKAITPEPSSLVLLGSGLAGLGGVIRRRRSA
jgi:hypothetical protein